MLKSYKDGRLKLRIKFKLKEVPAHVEIVDEREVQHVVEEVAVCNNTVNDPFLNELCSKSVIVDYVELPANDDEPHIIDDDYYHTDSEYRVKPSVVYPRHDPDQEWYLMEPILV